MRFYLTFGFIGFKIVNKGTMDLFKGSEDFGSSISFRISDTSSHYNTPCNRFYNNYVINICPRQLLCFI